MNLKVKEINKEKITSSLLGFIVGDALGVPYEFMDSKEIKQMGKIRMLDNIGAHHQPIGTWSDDSSMMLCTIESLLNGYNIDNMGNLFCKWWKDGYWTPHGKVFDIGHTTRQALKKVNHYGYAKDMGQADEYSNGNGSLMRILPLAFYLAAEDNLDSRKKIIEEVSGITHNHIYSKIGCMFYSEMVIQLLQGNKKKKAYQKTVEIMKGIYNEIELFPFSRIMDGKIYNLPKKKLSGSGYVVHSLESILWSFLNNRSYVATVTDIILLGEDTDTNAALAGSLAALYYENSIPQEWIEVLVKKEEIFELLQKFIKSLIL